MKKFFIFLAATLIIVSALVLSTWAYAQPQRPQVVASTVKVYFPRYSDPAFDHVYGVTRFVNPYASEPSTALQLVIGGPTLNEQNAYGLFSEVNQILTGPSNCSSRDFQVTLNHKGNTPEQGTATLHFCRQTQSPGIGTDARITNQLTATMRQFSFVKKVVILTLAGHCFGDESGIDHCLQ